MADVLVQGVAVPYLMPRTIDDSGRRCVAVSRGAFNASIAAGRVGLWIDHDESLRVQQQGIGKFTLIEREDRLLFSALISEPRWVALLGNLPASKRRGVSVAWKRETAVCEPRDGYELVTRAELVEVSLLLNQEPRFPGTEFRVSV